jgi:hypothetical protein
MYIQYLCNFIILDTYISCKCDNNSSETEDLTILPILIIDKYSVNIITLPILLTYIWSEYEHT